MIIGDKAKKVYTKDLTGKENGYLVELGKDGKKTTSYLTVAYPGCFKGFHAHLVREANYVCVKGKVKVILITPEGKQEIIMTSNPPSKLHIPINVPTGISNEWEEEAWLINIPTPAYDPDLKGEQLDFNEEDALHWVKESSERKTSISTMPADKFKIMVEELKQTLFEADWKWKW